MKHSFQKRVLCSESAWMPATTCNSIVEVRHFHASDFWIFC